MAMLMRGMFGLACLVVVSTSASAVWVTIRNDTDKVVVVQEVRVANGRLVKGKEYRLTPGEVLKEFQAAPGEKVILVSERDGAQAPGKVKLSWGKADLAFSVKKDGAELKLAPKLK